MRAALIDNAQRLHQLQDDVESLEDQIESLQQEAFGSDSEETVQKAREFFSNVGDPNDEPTVAQQIDELQEEKRQRLAELEEVRSDLLEQITDIRFPFDKSIDVDEGVVRFPFEDDIGEDVLDAIEEVLTDGLDGNGVRFNTDAIVADTESVDDAIESVEKRVGDIRRAASTDLDADKYARDLRQRDSKIALMLYTLRENEPMQKRELEDTMSLESGALRGQLYHVLNKEPYLEKKDQKISLTSTGESVINAYEKLYGEPSLDPEDNVEGPA